LPFWARRRRGAGPRIELRGRFGWIGTRGSDGRSGAGCWSAAAGGGSMG
jgi:hypothetical protein